jgi:hypothetical protein
MIFALMCVSIAVGFGIGYLLGFKQQPKLVTGPIIRLDTPCAACGHGNAELRYEAIKRKIIRSCKVCGCTFEQDPVAPDLFKSKS